MIKFIDRYDIKMGMSKEEDIVELIRYATRGKGFEEDNGYSRSSYFNKLEKAGKGLYNLSKEDSKKLADVFWFGGVGYISGWSNIDMLNWAWKELKPDTTIKYPYSLFINIDRDKDGAMPEKRWFDKDNNYIFRREIDKDVAIGKKCLHYVNDWDYEKDESLVEDGVCIKCLRAISRCNNKLTWDELFQIENDKEIKVCSKCGEVLSYKEICKHKNGVISIDNKANWNKIKELAN